MGEERVCHLCGTSEEEDALFKVDNTDSEYHDNWLCLTCYEEELGEEPTEDTQSTEVRINRAYEPDYDTDYDDIDNMDDSDINDILKEMFSD